MAETCSDIDYDANQDKIADDKTTQVLQFADLKITHNIEAIFAFGKTTNIEDIIIENTSSSKDIVIKETILNVNRSYDIEDFGTWSIVSENNEILFIGNVNDNYSSNITIMAGKRIRFLVSTNLPYEIAEKYENTFPIYFTYNCLEINAYAVLNNDNLTFYYDGSMSERAGLKWIVPEYDYYLEDDKQEPPDWVDYSDSIYYVDFNDSFAKYKPTNCTKWFMGVQANKIDCRNLNMVNVVTASYMFSNYWFKNNQSMVLGKISLVEFGEHFNTENCRCMDGMFDSFMGENFFLPDNFDTSRVTSFKSFLANEDDLYVPNPLTNIDFPKCFSLVRAQNISRFFYNQKHLKRVSGWNCDLIGGVDLSYMFYNCSKLEVVALPDVLRQDHWTGYPDNIFYNCINLAGINGYRWQKVDENTPWHAVANKDLDSLFTREKYGGISVNDNLAHIENVKYSSYARYYIKWESHEMSTLTISNPVFDGYSAQMNNFIGDETQQFYLLRDDRDYIMVESCLYPGYILTIQKGGSSLCNSNLIFTNNTADDLYDSKWLFLHPPEYDNRINICSPISTCLHLQCQSSNLSISRYETNGYFNIALCSTTNNNLNSNECNADNIDLTTSIGDSEKNTLKDNYMHESNIFSNSFSEYTVEGLIVAGLGCLSIRRIIKYRLKIKEFWLCFGGKYK